MQKISLVFYFTIFCALIQLQSQEQLGIRTDNYAGINATLLNPAAHLSTPFRWDINLGEVGLFVDNNYAYFQNTGVFELLRNRSTLEIVHAPGVDAERPLQDNEILLDYFTNNRRRFAQINTSILGPGFYVKIGENHAVGAYVRGRVEMSATGISNNFSYYNFFNRPFFEDFPVEDFQATFMSWSEIALNYMYQAPTDNGKLGIGITAKFIQPYEAMFFHSNNLGEIAKLPGDSIIASQADLEYGFTTSNLDANQRSITPNGNGLAFDLGVVYTIGDEENYDWKIGASILDLGKARFNKNANAYSAVIDSSAIIGADSYNTFDELTDLESLVNTFSQEVIGDSTAAFAGNEFGVWLPTAFSLQIDRAFTENIYLNATLVQSIPFSSTAVRRTNVLALSPRFEHRWFGATLPVVLYNWQDVRVGLSVKLGFLYLGSDNLGSLFGQSTFTGTDFYLALKVNPFHIGFGKKDKGGGRSKFGKRGNVKCYDF